MNQQFYSSVYIKKKKNPKCQFEKIYQIPYVYTVEMMNRFKGLDLVNRVPEELWTEIYNIVQEVVNRTNTRKRKERRQSGCLRRYDKQLMKGEK